MAAKPSTAIEAGLTPVLCVGGSQAVRDDGRQEAVVRNQWRAALGDLSAASILVAYEPIWAIGTGVTASPEQADAMHAVIRDELVGLLEAGASTPLLYGGSVNSENAAVLFNCPNVDGGLVGGASLEGGSFSKIVRAAEANPRH